MEAFFVSGFVFSVPLYIILLLHEVCSESNFRLFLVTEWGAGGGPHVGSSVKRLSTFLATSL